MMTKIILILAIIISSLATVFGQTCGIPRERPVRNRKEGTGQRIVGGTEPRPHSFPWLVSIQTRQNHLCGGALIPNGKDEDQTDIVLTAAHCVYNSPRFVSIHVGAHNLVNKSEMHQRLLVTRVTYHEEYDPDTINNDVALIQLRTPVKFNWAVQPICLPPPETDVATGTPATVAGWGLTEEDGKEASPKLLQIGIPIYDSNSCAKAFKDASSQVNSTTMICAGGDGNWLNYLLKKTKDTCNGDSGGPLMVKEDGRYVVRGTVSFSLGCARFAQPGVYARISHYIGWINQTISLWQSIRNQLVAELKENPKAESFWQKLTSVGFSRVWGKHVESVYAKNLNVNEKTEEEKKDDGIIDFFTSKFHALFNRFWNAIDNIGNNSKKTDGENEKKVEEVKTEVKKAEEVKNEVKKAE